MKKSRGGDKKMAKKILVADDEIPIQKILKYNLETAGFEVLIAGNGKEALDIAQKEKPDLILLDIMMPYLNGFEVCKSLKSDEEAKHIPIIMLTAKGLESNEKKGLELGADSYITKPFSPRKLVELVKEKIK